MLHNIFRLLIHAGFIVLFFWLVINARPVQADPHDTEGEALNHCYAGLPTADSVLSGPGLGGGGGGQIVCNTTCEENGTFWLGRSGIYGYGTSSAGPLSFFCSTRTGYTNSNGAHYWNGLCADEADMEHWATGGVVGETGQSNLNNPVSICHNGCAYDLQGPSGPAGENCQYVDGNSNGQPDAGESFSCPYDYSPGGGTCQPGALPDLAETPPQTSFDCENTDCSSPGGGGPPPDPPGPGSGDGSNLPPDPNDNDGSGGGDGDPDTPDGPGQGSGDTDGDDQRDVDCDPSSNPDCSYTGSASGIGNCDAPPACSGDPVQCALLYQQWANMCYDGGSFNTPADCNTVMTCEGDVLECENLRLQREQFCSAFVGDGTVDTNVFDDADFADDPKTDADVIDLETSFDQTGFASASCPPDTSIGTSYGNINLSFQPMCDVAGYVRVLVILSALILGAFIVTGTGKS